MSHILRMALNLARGLFMLYIRRVCSHASRLSVRHNSVVSTQTIAAPSRTPCSKEDL